MTGSEVSAPLHPLVSVVIPVYQNPEGIARALTALLDQTYPADSYEVIAVDNGSGDGTREVIDQFARRHGGRVRCEVEADVQSSYAARNRGLGVARGEVVAFTDSDCEPRPDWLEEGVRALLDADAAFAAGRVEMTFEGARPNPWEYYDAVANLNQRRYVESYGFGATANLFVRGYCFERYGLFLGGLHSGGDYEFGRRLTRAGEQGVYADRAVVEHPARARPGAILSKERRIALGQRRLESLGLLEHGKLSWRKLIPVRRCPPLNGVEARLSSRLIFVLLSNAVRYYALALRLLPGSKRRGASSAHAEESADRES